MAGGFGFSAAFLSKNKELAALVKRATSQGYEMDRFLDELKTTKWWKTLSDSQRRYDIQAVENPAELSRSVSQAKTTVSLLAARMGIGLSAAVIQDYARQMVRNGLSEEEIRNLIGIRYDKSEGGLARFGIAGRAVVDLKKMAEDYGIPISKGALNNFSSYIARGLGTVETYESWFRDNAKRQYAGVADQIEKGFTVRQILDPYLQMAAEELGVNPATMSISDGKWNAAISHRGKAGEPPRAMTFDEWTAKLRTDTKYGWDKTQNGQKAASTLATELMKRMGAM